ncbi:unnamed protein product [Somion occarium]|uniref:Uncharacterized protein n=1 Tax=Somion occarium TaxID=3059160 RepID=A0ABP1E9P1_9APHY
MSPSQILTITLNAVFSVWLRVLSWFIRDDTGPADHFDDRGVLSHAGVNFVATSPPRFTRPLIVEDNINSLIRDAVHSALLDPEDSVSPIMTSVGCPTLAHSPDFSVMSTPFTSTPTTPDLANELLIPIAESRPRIVTSHANPWDGELDLDLESGLGTFVGEHRGSPNPQSLPGSSVSLFSKLNVKLLTSSRPGSPSLASKFLLPSTPCRSRSNSTLPQFAQDITKEPLYADGPSWCGDDISTAATPGGSPVRPPTCYTNYFDFSIYDDLPDRRRSCVLDESSCDSILPSKKPRPLSLPIITSEMLYDEEVPNAHTPYNSPEKTRCALIAPLAPTRLDDEQLVRLLEDPDKMYRPFNTGLRPLILPRQAAKRHSLDVSLIRQGSGPKPLMLPQQLANKPLPARSSTLDTLPQKTLLRRSMSVQDYLFSQERKQATPPRQSRLLNDILALLNHDGTLEPLADMSGMATGDSQKPILEDSFQRLSPESSIILDGTGQEDGFLAVLGLLDEAIPSASSEDMRLVEVEERIGRDVFRV